MFLFRFINYSEILQARGTKISLSESKRNQGVCVIWVLQPRCSIWWDLEQRRLFRIWSQLGSTWEVSFGFPEFCIVLAGCCRRRQHPFVRYRAREDISLGTQTKKWSGVTLLDQGGWSRWPIVLLPNTTHCACDSVKTIKPAFFVCKIPDLYRITLSLGFFLGGFGACCCFFHAWTWAVASDGCFGVCVCLWAQCHIWSLSPHACLTADQVLQVSVTDRFSVQFTAHITEGEGRGKTVHKMYEETCREDAGSLSRQSVFCLSGRMTPWLKAHPEANNRAHSPCPHLAT